MVFSGKLHVVGVYQGDQFAGGDLESTLALDADLAFIEIHQDDAFAVVTHFQTQ